MNNSTDTNLKSKRLDWVDIAKGIAIILMVIGHEVKNVYIYAFIFSFHMPLFFILSGYTSSKVNNWNKFCSKQWQSFKRVWLLAVLMVFLLGFEYLVLVPSFNISVFWHNVLFGSFWGSNNPMLGIVGVGVMWFLFVFFWAKFVFDLLQVLLPNLYTGLLLFIVSGAMMWWCQNFAHFLPQTLDIVPIAALFMWIGALVKEKVNLNKLSNLNKMVFITVILVWMISFIYKIYIEMSVRHYPYLFLPVIEAVGGTIVICTLSKWISKSILSNTLQTIGKHTLAVMCIHHLDLYWVNWSSYIQSWPIAAIVRLCLDLLILAIFIYIQRWIIEGGKVKN